MVAERGLRRQSRRRWPSVIRPSQYSLRQLSSLRMQLSRRRVGTRHRDNRLLDRPILFFLLGLLVYCHLVRVRLSCSARTDQMEGHSVVSRQGRGPVLVLDQQQRTTSPPRSPMRHSLIVQAVLVLPLLRRSATQGAGLTCAMRILHVVDPHRARGQGRTRIHALAPPAAVGRPIAKMKGECVGGGGPPRHMPKVAWGEEELQQGIRRRMRRRWRGSRKC